EAGRQPPTMEYAVWTPERLFDLFPNLAERRNHLAGMLSGGEQQMLSISRTLMGNPELIILDEPTEGLAPIIVNQLTATIQRLKSEGISILMAEQNLNFTRTNCDRAYILYQGRIQYQSLITELSQEAYERYCAL
ncbi:MAG: ATP-binding cassette domain-containing protein, partial [Desulfobacterales bacterium]